jgi:hypothetical protein
MNGNKFINLSSSEKKKFVKIAIRGANKDQKALVEKYRVVKNDKQLGEYLRRKGYPSLAKLLKTLDIR